MEKTRTRGLKFKTAVQVENLRKAGASATIGGNRALANILKVSENTIGRWVNQGIITPKTYNQRIPIYHLKNVLDELSKYY